ncbi:hypothetical protein EPUS_08141 [Endocarpon pusillum Z07020]|uniref:DUF7580 domain-containing protein n=1 Tax=Endocarpon pusillum (strain Z07020 / HMAS-L-300199) TaxID=1263415 RepID=U1GGJ5_ENDPU|nr:uncharacterized protein EPUS_08141 [Endocarpon pusillum Z07020]ERF71223.1 hypothetical protein EPUS_08141 [Endocarpon pusillum Z07020]
MSGFEVAGVVLALFPIIVDGVRTYKHLTSGQSLEYLIKDILAEQIIFRSWMGHLLMPSVSVEALRDMLDPKSNKFGRWQDPGLQSAVQQSFGTTTTAFLLVTLNDIHKELCAIKKALSYTTLPDANTIGSRFSYTFQTARHTREDSGVRKRLQRLQELNAKLGQVFAVPKANAAPSANASACLPSVSGLEHATNVYQTIRKSYQCNCEGPHLTKLRLPPLKRRKIRSYHARGDRKKPVLNLLFSVEEPGDDYESIQAPLRIQSASPTRPSDHSLVSTGTSDEDFRIETSRFAMYKRASSSELSKSFSDLSLVGSNISTNTTVTKFSGSRSCSISVVKCINPAVEQIVDLCKTIKSVDVSEGGQQDSKSIGALPTVGTDTYELLADQSEKDSSVQNMTTLEDIFTSNSCKLARGVRVELAVHLTTAVLQLCLTPWITSSWSWGDFSIAGLEGRQLDNLSLFITHQFYSQYKGHSISSISDQSDSSLLRLTPGEPAVTRLGFALIELAFGKRLASMQGQFQNISGDPYYRDLAIAAALMNSGCILHEEGVRYHQAVLTCLKQEVQTPDGYGKKSLSFKDPIFQQDAANAILKPLVDLWTDFGGGSEPLA